VAPVTRIAVPGSVRNTSHRSALVGGEACRTTAAVHTHSPMFYIRWRLAAGARTQLDTQYREPATYVVMAAVRVQGRMFEAGKMLVFERAQHFVFTALTPAVVMLLGEEPIGWLFIE